MLELGHTIDLGDAVEGPVGGGCADAESLGRHVEECTVALEPGVFECVFGCHDQQAGHAVEVRRPLSPRY